MLKHVFAAAVLGFVTHAGAWQPNEPKADAAAPALESHTDEMVNVIASLKRALKDDPMARSIGYWESRMTMLDRIAAELPKLKPQALAAKKAMQEQFGPGHAELVRLFLSRKGERQADYNKMCAEARALAAKQTLNEEELAAAIEQGALDPKSQSLKYVQLFLVLDTRHQDDPVLAMDQGHVLNVGVPGSGKRPLATITIPKTFGVLGKGPDADGNVNLSFAGLGGAIISVNGVETPAPMTLDQAIEGYRGITGQALEADVEKARRIDTAIGKAAIIPITLPIHGKGVKAKGLGQVLVYTTPTHMVSITMSVNAMDGPNQDERLKGMAKRFGPLFEHVVRSVAAPESTPSVNPSK